MGIIEYHQGCKAPLDGCMGPFGNYYTVFGTELRFLAPHIIISAILGLILLGILLFLKKKEKITLPAYLAAIISIAAAALLFFLLAFFLPVQVLY